jgi:hypothetical protein
LRMESKDTYPEDGNKPNPPPNPLRAKRPVRWRLEVRIPNQEQKSIRQWYTHHCKLCAIRKASQLATALEMRYNVKPGEAKWSVAKYAGHINSVNVVANSDEDWTKLMRHHAH